MKNIIKYLRKNSLGRLGNKLRNRKVGKLIQKAIICENSKKKFLAQ